MYRPSPSTVGAEEILDEGRDVLQRRRMSSERCLQSCYLARILATQLSFVEHTHASYGFFLSSLSRMEMSCCPSVCGMPGEKSEEGDPSTLQVGRSAIGFSQKS